MTKLKKEYNNIYNEFKYNSKYNEMKGELHHGISRYDHINRVGKLSFYGTKLFHLDYISATRGALLHDFFTISDINKTSYKKYLKTHPEIALENAVKHFYVNEKEKDIIENHMYPITKTKPQSKESYIVSFSDKLVSIYEFFRFQVKLKVSIFILFLINIW